MYFLPDHALSLHTCITPVMTNGIIVRGKRKMLITDKARKAFSALNGSVVDAKVYIKSIEKFI